MFHLLTDGGSLPSSSVAILVHSLCAMIARAKGGSRIRAASWIHILIIRRLFFLFSVQREHHSGTLHKVITRCCGVLRKAGVSAGSSATPVSTSATQVSVVARISSSVTYTQSKPHGNGTF